MSDMIPDQRPRTRRWSLRLAGLASLSLALVAAACAPAAHQAVPTASAPTMETRAQPLTTAQSAQQAYIYGYPLVLMQVTKQTMTDVVVPDPATLKAPVGQFAHAMQVSAAGLKAAVFPTIDTLSSSAWLDLSAGPMVLHVPDTHGRYYAMELVDAWTDVVASLGSRTTGTTAGDFAIVGPGWSGTLPAGVHRISSPTNLVWISGRTQVNGSADVAAVHAIQQGYHLAPLSAWGKAYMPPQAKLDPTVDPNTPAVDQVAHMSAATFYGTLAAAMKANPPSAADATTVAQLKQLGIVPGQPLELAALPPATQQTLQQALQQAVPAAQGQISAKVASGLGVRVNGWEYTSGPGQYRTNYLYRAAMAQASMGASLDADTLYGYVQADAAGKPLSGANHYVLHFAPGQTPPVNGAWSVTMYGGDHFFVDNPLHRYALGHIGMLRYNPDASLDITIQQAAPGADKASNWLPAPGGPFTLVLRMYWPKPAALARTWRPPALTVVP
jgi:hypothetical protein